MKTVAILAGFTGYPNGKKRHFAQGEEPEIADAYADMIVGKSLAREVPAKPSTKPEPASQAPAEAKDQPA
ncbi:hypothetical protein [Devosia sp. 1635]|uniref:hypothetical protein n=1 Tax=Devosia sp. 1635 TaxID=2726066 RepID=UPI00156764E2|nr:hypothetical protein [Devosia sp. 1635]